MREETLFGWAEEEVEGIEGPEVGGESYECLKRGVGVLELGERGEVGIGKGAVGRRLCGEGDGRLERGEDFVGELEVVLLSAAEVGVAVLREGEGEVGVEEASEVGGPDEFLFAFAVVVEGEQCLELR